MKKTLITLLALAGVSYGVTLTDFTELNLTDGLTYTNTDTSVVAWSIALTLDVETIRPYMEEGSSLAKLQVLETSYNGNSNTIGINTNYSSDGNKIVKSNFWGTWGSGGAYNVSSLELASLDWDNIGSVALTATYHDANTGGDGTALAVAVYDKTGKLLGSSYGNNTTLCIGSNLQVKDITFANAVTGAYLYTSQISEADALAVAKTLGAQMVPEPTTATLSLLALAGLAARRRRK